MSHFTCLVIGDDYEEQLEPFHEFECTGINDEHIVDVDITDEVMADITRLGGTKAGLEHHGLEDRTVTDGRLIDKTGKHKYGYAVLDEHGDLERAVRRTNADKWRWTRPDTNVEAVTIGDPSPPKGFEDFRRSKIGGSEWDWYAVGGRWTGFFKMKKGAAQFGDIGEPGIMTDPAPEGTADQAPKCYIDFEAMRDAEEQKAREYWRKVRAVTEGEKWETRDQVRERVGTKNIDATREAFWDQPVIKKMRAAKLFMLDIDDNLMLSEDEYAQIARDQAVCTFAYLKDGEWHERGNMGWWGIVTNEKDGNAWNKHFNEMLDALPDDTMLTVVDCHI